MSDRLTLDDWIIHPNDGALTVMGNDASGRPHILDGITLVVGSVPPSSTLHQAIAIRDQAFVANLVHAHG